MGQVGDAVQPAEPVTATGSRRLWVRGRRWLLQGRGLDYLVGAGVVAAYATVQLFFLLGPRLTDPARYFDTAVDFPDVPADLWTLRIGLIVPVRLAVLAFGPSEAALYAIPVAAGLLLSAAIYGTMLVLFRDRALAAGAALVTVLNPVFLYYSSYIYPDALAAATFTAGFFLLALAAVRTEGGHRGFGPTLAVAGAGFFFGWTYLIREFSFFLLPAVAVAVVLLRYPVRRIALLAGTATATAALELVYGLIRYGDPFIHARHLLARSESGIGRGGAMERRMERIESHLDNVLDTMVVFPRLLLSWRTGWLFLLLIVVLVAGLALVRDRRFWLFAGWCASFWAIMTLIGIGELPGGGWILNVTNVRYWYPFLPALGMGASAAIWLLVQRWIPGPRGALFAPAAVLALSLALVTPGLAEFKSCTDRKTEINNPVLRWHELRSWLRTPSAERFGAVWTDGTTQRILPVYLATTFGQRVWHGDVETFAGRGLVPPAPERMRTLVLVQQRQGPLRRGKRGPEAVPGFNELRREWSPVFMSSDGVLVLLAHNNSATTATTRLPTRWWELSTPTRRVAPGTCGRNPYTAGDSE
jgi:hypothetical protein